MKLTKLTVTNFLSFKELDYDFVDSPVLIQGENNTDENQESNGAGKSSIQAAIEFSLFKTTSRKVRDIELIHFGEAMAEIQLSIYCPIRNENLLIERRIKAKGTGESQVSINAKIIYSFEDKVSSEVDKFILNWIGIAKEDLQNYFIVNKERYKSIFSSSNKEKVELINRFSNAKLIDGVDKFVQVDVDALTANIKQLEDSLNVIVGSTQALESEIQSERNRDIENEKQIQTNAILLDNDQIDNDIKNKQTDILLHEERLRALKPLIESKQSSLQKIQNLIRDFKPINIDQGLFFLDGEIADVKIQHTKLEEKNRSFAKAIKEVEGVLSDIEKNLAGTIVCPKCQHEFTLNKDVDLAQEKTDLESVNGMLQSYAKLKKETEVNLELVQARIDGLRAERSTLQSKTRFNDRWEDRFRKIKRKIIGEYDKIDADVKFHRNQVSLVETKIESLKLKRSLNDQRLSEIAKMSIDQDRINTLNAKIFDLDVNSAKIKREIEEKKLELIQMSQWIFNFKKFNMFLANQSLKIIQGYCNKFLQDLKSDIQVKWEGLKVLANGSLKEEITSYVIRDGEQRDFWSFSGGERARMEYAMFFTLQTMINKTHKFGGLDFFSSDEVVEGLDAQGLSDLMKSLSMMNRTVLLTTHVVNRNINENILLVRKVNGVSEIVKN